MCGGARGGVAAAPHSSPLWRTARTSPSSGESYNLGRTRARSASPLGSLASRAPARCPPSRAHGGGCAAPVVQHLDDYLTLVGNMYYQQSEVGQSTAAWALIRRTTLGVLTAHYTARAFFCSLTTKSAPRPLRARALG